MSTLITLHFEANRAREGAPVVFSDVKKILDAKERLNEIAKREELAHQAGAKPGKQIWAKVSARIDDRRRPFCP